MKYRNLGNTGIKVSPLCLGTLNFGGSTAKGDSIQMIHTALDAGINFIDTADYYNSGESERITGQALAGRRNNVILATKAHYPMPGRTDPNARGNSRRSFAHERRRVRHHPHHADRLAARNLL